MLLLLACSAPSGFEHEDGTLAIVQLDCPGGTGESTLVIGLEGLPVLIDVGNDRHAACVMDKVRGYTGADRADTVVLTHFHEDHAGGMDGITTDRIVSRGPVHLGGADFPDGMDGERTDLCTANSCDLPWSMGLGGDAKLTIFAGDGRIGDADVEGLPDDDDGENARSLVGVVTWDDFTYLFAGDLTGGGKGTPDVESAFAGQVDPWVPSAGVTVLHTSHHGIDSSTNEAWIDRMLPGDEPGRAAIVGSNSGYLDAPADEVLARLSGRVDAVWANRGGALTGADPALRVVGGDVAFVAAPEGVTVHADAEVTTLR